MNNSPTIANTPARAHLLKVKSNELQDAIRRFRGLNHRSLSYSELQGEILKVLCAPGVPPMAFWFPGFGTYPMGTTFFRIRKAEADDRNFPLRCLSVERDAWNPPPEFCKLGRLNKVGESLLYTSPSNPNIAMDEMRLAPDDLGCLMVYRATREIKVAMIGSRPEFVDATDDERLKLNLLHDFLHDEFIREVGVGSEHLYRISEIIAKDYFDLPPRAVQDAWCYPSVVTRPAVNVCFREDIARECLSLSHVLLGHRLGAGLQVRIVAEWSPSDGVFHYHPMRSEAQRRLAPEITFDSAA